MNCFSFIKAVKYKTYIYGGAIYLVSCKYFSKSALELFGYDIVRYRDALFLRHSSNYSFVTDADAIICAYAESAWLY